MHPRGRIIPTRRRPTRRRRGVILVESAIIYSVTLTLLLGTIVMGMGVFRYNQVAALAREGSRWASVHGSLYLSETPGATAITAADVMKNAVTPKLIAMDPAAFTSSLTMTSGKAIFTLKYKWTPEAYFAAMTLTSVSTTPIRY